MRCTNFSNRAGWNSARRNSPQRPWPPSIELGRRGSEAVEFVTAGAAAEWRDKKQPQQFIPQTVPVSPADVGGGTGRAMPVFPRRFVNLAGIQLYHFGAGLELRRNGRFIRSGGRMRGR